MKSDWVVGKIEDLCEIEYGTRVVRKRDAGEVYPVYGGGGATFNMDIYNRQDRMVIARFGMSERCTRFVSGKFFLNDSGLTIIPKDENAVYSKFLNYQILSLNDEIYKAGRGTAQKNLNVDEFKKIIIGYPGTIAEQMDIVRILDSAFERIDAALTNVRQNIINADELFQSKLTQIFSNPDPSWQTKTIDKMTVKNSTIRWDGLNYEYKYVDLSSVDRKNNGINITSLVSVNSRNAPSRAKKIIRTNDIIFGTTRPTLRRIAVIDEILDSQICSTGFCVLRCAEELNYKYLFYALQSDDFYKYIGSKERGTSYPAVTDGDVKSYKIAVPSVDTQESIVKGMDRLRVHTNLLLKKYREEEKLLIEIKKSLLQEAFAGKLTNNVI